LGLFTTTLVTSNTAKNFALDGTVIDFVRHWRLSNSWKLIQSTSKNLSKFCFKITLFKRIFQNFEEDIYNNILLSRRTLQTFDNVRVQVRRNRI